MSQRAVIARLVRPPAFVPLAAVLVLMIGATLAAAFVPGAERISRAIADSNRGSGRAQALRFELEMRIGDSGEGPLAARGELVTHPTGMARRQDFDQLTGRAAFLSMATVIFS